MAAFDRDDHLIPVDDPTQVRAGDEVAVITGNRLKAWRADGYALIRRQPADAVPILPALI